MWNMVLTKLMNTFIMHQKFTVYVETRSIESQITNKYLYIKCIYKHY